MTLALLEGAVDALKTYLEANMEAKVTDLNTRYSDEMGNIKEWYIGNMPTAIPEYPSIVILGDGLTPKTLRAVSLHIANEINLIVFVGNEDPELRFRRLCRYALGLIELCVAGESSIGYKLHFLSRMAVTDVMDTQPYLQGIIIPVTLEQIEEF